MSYNPTLGLKFSGPDNFNVTYHSPRRKIGNLREEFNNDAVELSKNLGMVYIAFSSGVDSQIIARSFLDMGLDAEYVFLHNKGNNELELEHVLECEKFYGIKVRKIELDINEHKDKWIADNEKHYASSITQYPFLYLSEQLEEDWPIITQGKAEPAIVGVRKEIMSIYHNYYEDMELRFALMKNHRRVYDFPFSPEAIASYYTEDNLKVFASNIKYFSENRMKLSYSQYFNMYAKPFVKGKYYRDDVIWYSKLTGAENYPKWMLDLDYIKETRVSVPYWDLVEFLENTLDEEKTYNDWIYQA